jgi:hypothetical protein
MPFDMTGGQAETTPQTAGSTMRRRTGLVETLLAQGGALTMGLTTSFIVLLVTKQVSVAAPGLCALGAMVVIGLWLSTAGFRRDRMVYAVSSTLCLVPVVLIECGWINLPNSGLALIIETVCLGLLFAGSLRRLGAEATGRLARGR